jgi:hypothetical protein
MLGVFCQPKNAVSQCLRSFCLQPEILCDTVQPHRRNYSLPQMPVSCSLANWRPSETAKVPWALGIMTRSLQRQVRSREGAHWFWCERP